jgi:hypothetical protein
VCHFLGAGNLVRGGVTVDGDCPDFRGKARDYRRGKRRRLGAILSAELLLVLPLVAAAALSLIEFGMLMVGQQRVETAARGACRAASLPADSEDEAKSAAWQAARGALGNGRLAEACDLRLSLGRGTGDDVVAEVRVPMNAAAPDMLRVFGLSLEGRCLRARCMMRKE